MATTRSTAASNEDVAAVLYEYADLLAITAGDSGSGSGGGSFKSRAYERAARAVGGHPQDVSGMTAQALKEIPGVGSSIADKIGEFLQTGTIGAVEEARGKIPAGVRELTAIPALGPRKALLLYEELHISSVEELADAIGQRRLRDLKGFGPKTEEKLLHGIELLRTSGERVRIDVAMATAERIVAALSAVKGCRRCAYAGSLRRMRATVGDLDILAAAADSSALMRTLVGMDDTAEVIVRGETKTSIRTREGLQIDLRVVPLASWGAALQYFTGSKAHNIRTRAIAQHRGLKLSEYGLEDAESGRKVRAETEQAVYRKLGLAWVPPALREDRGEIEAAMGAPPARAKPRAGEDELPELVGVGDLRGDLHTHTDLTDGIAPLEEMLRAAADRGYSYYAVTDHAPDLAMQRMTKEKILEQRARLDGMGRRSGRMRLLHGTELNIGPEGGVDWPGDFLAEFDLCVASVHSHFDQSRAAMTKRFTAAAENPYVHIIGHPTTRIQGKRGPVDADWDAVFAACARTGTALEINAHPHRLDLPDDLILRARRAGVRFAVDSDAHSVPDLANMRYGVGTAQRGWLTAEDVINTWPLQRLRRFLGKRG